MQRTKEKGIWKYEPARNWPDWVKEFCAFTNCHCHVFQTVCKKTYIIIIIIARKEGNSASPHEQKSWRLDASQMAWQMLMTNDSKASQTCTTCLLNEAHWCQHHREFLLEGGNDFNHCHPAAENFLSLKHKCYGSARPCDQNKKKFKKNLKIHKKNF